MSSRPADIIRGYEYDKDRYIVVTDEEIEKIKTEKEKAINILHFADLGQISPVFYDKTYQTFPEPGGEKAFELLRAALMEEGKVAVGKTVFGMKDTLMAIIPREEGMLISTMFFQDEVREAQKAYPKQEVRKEELDMAKLLIHSMDAPFEPASYHDEYQAKLRSLIDTKLAGHEVVAARPEGGAGVISLMDALRASLETAQNAPGKKPAANKPSGKKAPEKEKAMA